MPEGALPKDRDGTLWAHLFALDLDERPELRARYDGVEALAFFCPEPDTGERSDDDPVSKAIRRIVFNAAGHVRGEPLWILEDEGGGDDWVMQINESLSELNLGDCGSLYVFESSAVFQCY